MSSRSSTATNLVVPTPPSSGPRRRTRALQHDEPLPAVDERLVVPEARVEIIDGKVYFVPPANEPHGESHLDLGAVIHAHLAPGYSGALDMLTRTSKIDDFAPDASVYPSARDPNTGGRQLEELAFEIVANQAFSIPRRKARKLLERGVRRVFCLALKKKRVLEFSLATDNFEPLPDDSTIEDHCFVRPIPVRALLDGVEKDRAIILALHTREDATLMTLLDEARDEGIEKGIEKGIELERLRSLRETLCLILRSRGEVIDEATQARINACTDVQTLELWIVGDVEITPMPPPIGDCP